MKRTWRDPVTGDDLTFAEHVSWMLQGFIRNWWFIGTITAATIATSIAGRAWNFALMDVWNFTASYLALFIESIVGIAMFSQTRRDAVKIRKIEALSTQLGTVIGHLESVLSDEIVVDTKTYDLVAHLAKLHDGGTCPTIYEKE